MENATRAIMIGAGLFITMITISAIILYYNSAKQLVDNVTDNTDISGNYSEYIRDTVLSNGRIITGADVKNILNYFYGSARTEISVTIRNNFANEDMKLSTPETYNDVTNDKTEFTNVYNQIVDNSSFAITYTLYDNSDDIKTITVVERVV